MIVAMANESSPNSNGIQFFFTLDKCDWLYKKHTIFGKVTGDSIFNLLRLGEVVTGKDDRPLDPALKLLSVEILWNAFEGIVPRVSAKTSHVPVAEAKEPPKKATKKLDLLSFGEKAEKEEKELAAVKQKIKCSHDSKEVLFMREALGSKNEAAQKDKSLSVSDPVGHSDVTMTMKTRLKLAKDEESILNRRKEMEDIPPNQLRKKIALV